MIVTNAVKSSVSSSLSLMSSFVKQLWGPNEKAGISNIGDTWRLCKFNTPFRYGTQQGARKRKQSSLLCRHFGTGIP